VLFSGVTFTPVFEIQKNIISCFVRKLARQAEVHNFTSFSGVTFTPAIWTSPLDCPLPMGHKGPYLSTYSSISNLSSQHAQQWQNNLVLRRRLRAGARRWRQQNPHRLRTPPATLLQPIQGYPPLVSRRVLLAMAAQQHAEPTRSCW
jgi:hypothetical protein